MKFSVESILDPIPALHHDFRYPVGYFEPEGRVTDSEVLSRFEEIFHPFIVRDRVGEATIDPHAPVAVRRLKNGRCKNL